MLNGERVYTKPLQCQILLLLVQEQGGILTHQHLKETLWHGSPPHDPGALSQLVHGLRRLLERGPLGGKVIRTFYGQGYAYIGPMRELPLPPSPIIQAEEQVVRLPVSSVSAPLLRKEAWARWRYGNPLDLPEVVRMLKDSLAIESQNAEALLDLCHGLLVMASWGMVPPQPAAAEVQSLLKQASELKVDVNSLGAIQAEMLSLLCWQPGRSDILFASWLPEKLGLDRPLLSWVRHLVFSGQCRTALKLLDPKLQIDLPQGWGLKAHAHIQLRELPQAETALRQQMAAGGSSFSLPVQLAVILALQGHSQQAAELVEQARILDEGELSGLHAMAAFSLIHGPHRETAEHLLERVVVQRWAEERWTGALSVWGLVALGLGKSGLATQLLVTAVKERCTLAPVLLHGPLLDAYRHEPAVGVFQRKMAQSYF
jgi:DNA-binding winged helix-turn-helix (wHTH) protein